MQLFIQAIVEIILVNEIVQLHLQLVIELFEGKLVTNFHLIPEGLYRDFHLSFIDQVLVDGYVMLLHINLHLC